MIQILGNKKTRKGWLGQRIKQTYTKDDISCGIQYCLEHKNPIFPINNNQQNILYFIDEETLFSQLDIIQNSSEINNLVVIQSFVENLKIKKPILYNQFKHFVQRQIQRRVYIFPNQYHASCLVPFKNQLIEEKNAKSLVQTVRWFVGHIRDNNLKVQVKILTSSFIVHKYGNQYDLPIISLVEFLKNFDSNLLDFVGFIQQSTAKEFSVKRFPQHVESQKLIQGIKKGIYLQGKYMNTKSYFKIQKQMFSCQLQNNRAMYGDIIAIQIYPQSRWKKNLFNLQQIEDQINNKQIVQAQTGNNDLLQSLKNTLLIPTGRVVGILKRNIRNYCGSISDEVIQTLQNKAQIRQFIPVDIRYPSFYIKTFNAEKLAGKRFIISFDKWPSNSINPLGHFKKIIGPIGDIKTQGDVILLQHNVEISIFSKAVYDCLPPEGDNYVISNEEIKKRLDLRNIDVVSIDPPGCKDIDDALHCVELSNGNYEVGVHIADVSYFVKPDTAIDKEASHRSTTVYLVDRRTDMLPKLLTQNLCSLRANVQRLVFSTIWQMDKHANIIKSTYCKSIIKSRRAFTYGEAQSLIDDVNDNSPITRSIRNLNILAKKLKQKRLDNGALQLASTQVKFSFSDDTHNPTDVQLYNLMETNSLIQEFMLLSNIAVAEKIVEKFPSISILRHHVPPKHKQLQQFKRVLEAQGFQFQFSTSKQLADSLDHLNRNNDEFFNKLMRIMTTRCMNQATYFCSADFDIDQFYHYGLACSLYTHFTSPIRRYADVLTHRLLAAAIDIEPLPNYMSNKLKMSKICEKMNMRHRMARFASRASSDYHTYLFFKDKNLVQKAIITSITQQGFMVMLPKFGLESLIKFNPQDKLKNELLNKNESIIISFYSNGKLRKIFEYLKVKISVELKGFHKKIILEEILQ